MAQYNGQQDIKVVRRYFDSTTTLRAGQVLAYRENASTTGDMQLRLGNVVEPINTDNQNYVAGIVPDTEAGKVGPCFVELLVPQPGDVVSVEVEGTTDVAAGDLLEPDGTSLALIKATAGAGDYFFRALEAQAANSKVAILAYKV